LNFVYHSLWSLPDGVDPDENKLAVELHYYIWQISAYFKARQLHHDVGFDLVNHVTYVRYWMPSLMALLPIPFVLGPVGGAESAPSVFWNDLDSYAGRFEKLRDIVRWVGEHDLLVRRSVRGSDVALATTRQTADRLRHLGAPCVEVLGEGGLRRSEVDQLGSMASPPARPLRFLSLGRLLHWKGFHLGLRAFARANLDEAVYWVVGDGPWRDQLEAEARTLGIDDRVRFWGRLPRPDAMEKLAASHVLVHPSLHDSGGWVCLEAMAARRPVLCLDIGGPSHQVTSQTGVKVPPHSPVQVVRRLAEAMTTLAHDQERRTRMGDAGHQRVLDTFLWEHKTEALLNVYNSVLQTEEGPAYV
jgi:glycosyltransferase involved in cell wall biosynthesis